MLLRKQTLALLQGLWETPLHTSSASGHILIRHVTSQQQIHSTQAQICFEHPHDELVCCSSVLKTFRRAAFCTLFWIRSGRGCWDFPCVWCAAGITIIKGKSTTEHIRACRGTSEELCLFSRSSRGAVLRRLHLDDEKWARMKRAETKRQQGCLWTHHFQRHQEEVKAFLILTTVKFQQWRVVHPLVMFPSRCLAEESEGEGDSSRCGYLPAQLSSKSRCLAPTAPSSGLSPVSASLSTAHSSSFTPFWQSPGPF